MHVTILIRLKLFLLCYYFLGINLQGTKILFLFYYFFSGKQNTSLVQSGSTSFFFDQHSPVFKRGALSNFSRSCSESSTCTSCWKSFSFSWLHIYDKRTTLAWIYCKLHVPFIKISY
jgi:hypothetical protein